MIHNWLNAKRNKSETVRERVRNMAVRNEGEFGSFEQLEDKRCLAILGFFDGITLDINQTADDGDIVVENTTGVWRATDNLGTFTFVNARHLNVNLLDNTANQLDLYIDTEHIGNVGLNLGNGVRDVYFQGALNEMGGNLVINGGSGNQQIDLQGDLAASLIVHGNTTINLGQGNDLVHSNGGLVTIDKNLSLVGVNEYRFSLLVGLPGPPITGGNVTMDTSMEDRQSFLIPEGGGTLYGNFTYKGGVNIDHVDMGGMFVEGDVDIDLGVGEPFFGDPQNVEIAGTVNGDVNIVAGDSNLGNEINLLGAFNGNIVSYTGGDLVDVVTYSFVGEQADVFADMGGGDDIFDLTVLINTLEIDFGNDLHDSFLNNLTVPFELDFDIFNFQFFNHFYTHLDDTLVMNQLADTGNVIFDNDGGLSGFDWQMFTGIGAQTSTVAAENLVLTMLPNTGNNVEMDLINPVIASIMMDLGDGNRAIQFTGISNNPLRDIGIMAGAGSQVVDLSVNHPLGVATLNIDLGSGFDTVNDNANSLIVDEDLILVGVNEFVNDGLLSIFRNAFIDTTGEVEDSLFASNGSMFVGSQFTYTGGAGRDEVRLNGIGGTVITKAALIDLGDSVAGDPQYILVDNAGTTFKKALTVASSNATGSDLFASDPGTHYLGNLSINLGGGANQANIVGVFGGSTVAYTGGSGADNVTYGLTGVPAGLTVSLGAGDDTFTLLAGTSIASPLTIDFGGGNDTFVNNYGSFTFNANLLNLSGFNHVYVHATSTLTSTQLADFGNVIVDSNGPAGAIRFIGVGTSTITPANNLVVNMLSGSTSNLDIDLDTALSGNLTVNLGSGDRALNFTGTNNSIGGVLNVTGGTGNQTVEIAVNSPFSVGGNATFSLGTGNDTVDEDGNNTSFGGTLNLLGVNTFVNNATMTIGGNVLFDVAADPGTAVFADNSPMTINGNFTYNGSSGDDQILLDPTTTITGNVLINAGAGNNVAYLVNMMGGSNVFYAGFNGMDTFTYGMTGSSPTLNVNLGAGDDTFNLLAGADFAGPLVIDFGSGADTFTNSYGVFDFDAVLKGLNGFDHVYTFATATLTSTQVEDLGPVTVDNNGLSNSIRFISGGTSSLTPASNLTINMKNGTASSLDVALDNAHAGNLSLNLADGGRALNLTGSLNSIGGNLAISGGSGVQTVDLAVNAGLSVAGHALIDLAAGNDVLSESGNGIDIMGNLGLTGVNTFTNNGTVSIGGNFSFNSSAENETSLLTDNGMLSIVGNFDYSGGGARDVVALNSPSATSIGGNVTIDLGDNVNAGTQQVSFAAPATIGGAVTISATGTTNPDSFQSADGVMLAGNLTINLGGGINQALIGGNFSGSEVKYNGGSGADTVTYRMTGTPINPNIKLSTGNDLFILDAGAAIDTFLRVDFGGGNDSFTNNYGAFTFDADLLNWHGYNRFYTLATDSLAMVQVLDTGNITLDNNGAGGAIRLNNGFVTEMTPATDLRLILVDGTSTSVTVDLDSALAGSLILQLRSGARNVTFTGTSNTVGGLLRIEASEGIQNVYLAVNADMNVGGNLVINGRNASDSVNISGHAVNVANAMILRSINTLNNSGTLAVAGDFNMIGVLENELTRLLNTGTFNVAGNVTYLGGGGVDEFSFSAGSASIGGFTYVNLGDSNLVQSQQVVRLTGNFSTDLLQVTSGNSIGGNSFLTSATTNVTDDLIVNFTNSNKANTAVFRGTYSGTYGTYRGGSQVDTVTFGASGVNMEFATLVFGGNDVYTLETTADLDFMFVDFGAGTDTYINNIGNPLPFASSIINLP
jgi:hypothetical protein